MKTLAECLSKARKNAGLTQAQLAEKISRPQSWIASLENGRYPDPSGKSLRLIAQALNGSFAVSGEGYLFKPN